VNILIVCARFPERGRKGDQLRALQHVELLRTAHEITVVTSGRPSSDTAVQELGRLATLHLVRSWWLPRSVAAVAGGLRGRPLQVGWMTPRALRRAVGAAAKLCDVVLVVTIRCLPNALPAPTVLDHVDALSRNMAKRARLGHNPALRLGARFEARALAAHETHAAAWVAAQTAVSSLDAAALPTKPAPVVLPLVWDEGPATDAVERDIDVILTGNMRYPPNRDAARWLAAEIVPRLRERRPDIFVLVAGRAASSLRLTGVEVASDVDDLSAQIRRAKVAIVPVRNGTGVPIKLLEAVDCGAAVVSTPWAARAADLDIDTAEDPEEFAAAVERLLADGALREQRIAAARAGLEARRPAVVGATLERLLADAATAGAET
jgi:hypothetical protein